MQIINVQKLTVKSRFGNYQVIFYKDFKFFRDLKKNNFYFIVDRQIFKLYKETLFDNIDKKKLILLAAKEETKTIGKVKTIYASLLENSINKNATLVSVGGGVMQDVSGFIASTLFRGIKWLYVPTTLLSQADSCIGSKTSINFRNYKNLIGTFYPPAKIYISSAFLKTLNMKDFYSGLGEIIKLQLIDTDSDKFKNLVNDIKKVLEEKDSALLLSLIESSLRIKKHYIEKDEFDHSVRNLLNYGHTLGHALESVSNFRISHGMAVILGVIYANILSVNRSMQSEKSFKFLTNFFLLPNAHLDMLKLKSDYFDKEKLMRLVKRDKKQVNSKLTFIIPANNFKLNKVDDISYKEFNMALSRLKTLLFRSN
ncbi:hypothetical protein A2956_04950 [Candidatus Roizmanbacteria bacterium RIFCSPLOWO2_01_FULL_37_57]|nr:MAG: hypothetical protein A2956_04950 [Candidatus Roizmanbacteria bacterium RIFCSPLOWO2_01_FULL_37_57]